MDTPDFRTAAAADLDAIARFTAELNAVPEHRCLLCPETPEDVRRDMAEYGEHPEDHFVLALRGGTLAGAVACDWSVPQARGWVLGPFVAAGDWDVLAPALLDRLLERVPSGVRRLDTYTDVANERALALYRTRGFKIYRRAQVYSASSMDPVPAPPARLLEPEHEAAFLDLHARTFPEAPDPGPDLLARRSDARKIFAAVRDGALAGYLACRLGEAPVEGFVDYLAVAEGQRGRGTGSALLRTAMDWCLRERAMPQVSLVVHETNRDARSIYERAGFRLLYTGVATTRRAP